MTWLVPAWYVERFIAAAELDEDEVIEVLAMSGLDRARLSDPAARIAPDVFGDVIWRCVELTGDASLGIEVGLAFKPASHGLLGLALMTCNSLRDAIAVVERFGELRVSPWRLQLLVEGQTAILRFVEVVELGRARAIMFETVVGGAIVMGEFILGESLAHPDIELWSDSPELPHHAHYHGQLPRIRYDRPTNEARFPASWLDRQLVMREPIANREALAMLERERMLVAPDDDLLERTRAVLAGFPDLEEAARMLGVSSRTLRRHLTRRGTTFHRLRDEARRAHAIGLLERSTLTVEAIASELAYADAGSFVRAFQRWTGETPLGYRRRVQRGCAS